jgi:hypothetical protein
MVNVCLLRGGGGQRVLTYSNSQCFVTSHSYHIVFSSELILLSYLNVYCTFVERHTMCRPEKWGRDNEGAFISSEFCVRPGLLSKLNKQLLHFRNFQKKKNVSFNFF